MEHRLKKYLRRGAALLLVLFGTVLAGAVAAFLLLTGPRHFEAYPSPAASPYLLPWTGGETRFCIQGNRAVVSHRGWEEHAFDFVMPVGTDVRAARAGTVTKVVVEHDGNGRNWPNNRVVVQHEDGSLAEYLHLKQNGSYVKVGDEVTQGQVIAASGNVGNSMLPHLHFHVTAPDRSSTLPITFKDVPIHDGIPRMFHHYTSGNATAPR